MKMLLASLIIAFMFSVGAAQTVHIAGSIGASNGLGFSNPTAGVGVGGEWRKDRIGLSGDFNLDRITKKTGGNGFQLTGRETFRVFKGKLFVQVCAG